MPTQMVRLHHPMAKPDCPEWVATLFTITAFTGFLAVTPFLFGIAIWAYADSSAPIRLLPGIGLLLVCWGVLWRQSQLKRWACFVACLAAWGIAYHSAFSAVGSGDLMEWGWRAVTILLAPAMTAALIAGWEGLERGF